MDVSKVKVIGIEKIRLPEMVKISQNIPNIYIANIEKTIKEQIKKTKLNKRINKGSKVAITVGSRGIDQLSKVIKIIASEVKKIGGKPFIIPAMGSHGGATAKGQEEVLRELGITEENIGAPIISSMKVVKIGKTKSDLPVYVDENALLSDAIIVVNRVKVHTDFSGEIESGLFKMMAVGLGKHKGASILHGKGLEMFSKIIPEVGFKILEKAPVALGIALVENSHGKLSKIVAIDPENFLEKEKKLLSEEKILMPKLPFSEIDILLVNEIGKNISGAGMDPNIVGRSQSKEKNIGKNIHIIIPLDITEISHGNGVGIGLSDISTKSVFEKINFNAFYTNLITSRGYLEAKIPIILENDEYAVKVAMKMLDKNDKNVKMLRIQNTININEMEISTALLEDSMDNNLKIIGERRRLRTDRAGNLLSYPYSLK